MTISLWQDIAAPIPTDPFPQERCWDVAIVGAGLAGLSLASMLVRDGLSVVVVEARRIGDVTTGRSTGKLSLLQGSVMAGIRRSHSKRVLKAYVDGNLEAQRWLTRFLTEQGVAVERRDAFTYARTPEGAERIEQEIAAMRSVGLDVQRADDTGLPFPTAAAIRLAEQVQIDPLAALRALAADVRAHGGIIVEQSRVTAMHVGDPVRLVTEAGELRADRAVLATGIPFLDRGLYFAKVQPTRSYLQAFRTQTANPAGMYLSVDDTARSLRTATGAGEELLLVGGNDHVVGRAGSTAALAEDLRTWTQEFFPGAERTHAWSAQDYRSANMTPFVGWMPRTHRRVAVATGFNKWGMTNAVAAARSIRADIVGVQLPWARVLHRRVSRPPAFASVAAMNAEVGGHLVSDWATALLHPLPDAPLAEGEGAVGRVGAKPVAVSRVDGATCRVSGVCPHLGGVLRWNAAETSWDCPLHGSRFDHRGRLLEGPATQDLRQL